MTEQTPTPDIWSLTPQQASERLEAMKAPPAPAVDLATPVDISTMTAAQARAHFDARSADEGWVERLMNGGMKEQKELTALMERRGDSKLEQVLAHGDEGTTWIETTFDGALTARR
jgi:hypothetical protein